MPLVEPKVTGDFILSEGAARLSREVKTVAAGNVLKMGQVCKTSSGKKVPIAGTGNEAHTYTPDAAPTAGTFRLSLWHKDGYQVTTADIAYNASAGTIQTAINAVLGTSAVTVSGTAATAIIVTFGGTGYAALSWELGYMDFSKLIGVTNCTVTRSTPAGASENEQHTLIINGTPTAGTFKLNGIPKPDGSVCGTTTINYNATFSTVIADINTALDAATGIAGGIVATGTAWNGILLTYSGGAYAGKSFPVLPFITIGLTGATSFEVQRTRAGGLAGGEDTNLADSICLEAVDASAADQQAVFLTRNAVVNANKLYYGGGDPATCQASLAKVDIMARSEAPIASHGT